MYGYLPCLLSKSFTLLPSPCLRPKNSLSRASKTSPTTPAIFSFSGILLTAVVASEDALLIGATTPLDGCTIFELLYHTGLRIYITLRFFLLLSTPSPLPPPLCVYRLLPNRYPSTAYRFWYVRTYQLLTQALCLSPFSPPLFCPQASRN